jgi:hypothetical protein
MAHRRKKIVGCRQFGHESVIEPLYGNKIPMVEAPNQPVATRVREWRGFCSVEADGTYLA